MKKWIAAGVILLVASSIALWKFRPSPKPAQTKPHKVFLIGLDGASWNLMQGLLQSGKLPNFQRLIESGTSGNLKSFVPTKSPILWTTIATGKVPSKHGIGNFTAEVNGKTVPVSGTQRLTKAFWNILSDYNVRVGVVNWWVTWPPEKVNGFMVSDRYRSSANNEKAVITYPENLVKDLPKIPISMDRYLEERRKFGLPENLKPDANSKVIDQLATDYKGYWAQDRAVRESCRRLLTKQNVDVFAVIFRIIDVSSHLFWTYLDPNLIAEMRTKSETGNLSAKDIQRIDAEFTKFIGPIYEYSDRILGEFLHRADSDTHFIVLSDHGFKFEEGRYGHSAMNEPPPGIIILSGPSFRKNHMIQNATLLDIAPTLLYLQNIPVARDMDGKILANAFTKEFMKQTQVRVITSHDTGMKKKGQARESEMDEEILEDLKTLGYIN
ncbi:MAG TPA: alkaline phosphatase family protein [Acidobacteriota bacterium]|nr:alkaline phosphatase family protein [Acidobacteriota bacterium]